jgi:hypothetical protein
MNPTIIVHGIPGVPVFQSKIEILKARLRQALGGPDERANAYIASELVKNEAFGVVEKIHCFYVVYNLPEMPQAGKKIDFKTEIENIIERHCKNCQSGVKISFDGGAEDLRAI